MVINASALLNELKADLTDCFGDCILDSVAPEDRGVKFASKTLLSTLLKKCITEVHVDADDRAIQLFRAANQRCKEWSLDIKTMHDEYLIGHFHKALSEFFDDFVIDTHALVLNGGCGPGASVGARGNDFYTKLFDSGLTYTSPVLLRAYRTIIGSDPKWAASEQFRTVTHGDGSIVDSSKLTCVPKRDDISRVICTEPSLNMYFQKGLAVGLEYFLKKKLGIDLSTQPDINRELARLGSLKGRLSTIDLSSASDTISMRMLERFLPRQIYTWLKVLRSPNTILPNGEKLELSMISSMGNGFTFPLETIIFSAVVTAVYQLNGIPLKRTRLPRDPCGKVRYGNFGVFGDDIICDVRVHKQVLRLLVLLGFTPNAEKTFSEGLFRESCGADYVGGYPVRGVYVKQLDTVHSRYVALNRLMSWSALHSVPLPKTIGALRKSVPWNPVPLFENDDAGIKIPLRLLHVKRRDRNLAVIYKPWRTRPNRLKIGTAGIVTNKGQRPRHYNADALLLSFVGGYIMNGIISLKSPKVRYSKSEAVTASWDFLSRDLETVGLARLDDVVAVNLFG
jgi:hypothetical protein